MLLAVTRDSRSGSSYAPWGLLFIYNFFILLVFQWIQRPNEDFISKENERKWRQTRREREREDRGALHFSLAREAIKVTINKRMPQLPTAYIPRIPSDVVSNCKDL